MSKNNDEAKLEHLWSDGGLWGLILLAVGLLAVLTGWINRVLSFLENAGLPARDKEMLVVITLLLVLAFLGVLVFVLGRVVMRMQEHRQEQWNAVFAREERNENRSILNKAVIEKYEKEIKGINEKLKTLEVNVKKRNGFLRSLYYGRIISPQRKRNLISKIGPIEERGSVIKNDNN